MSKSQQECDPNNPEEAFAWMFAAGIPDPRGEKFPNQPLVPPACFPALSRMLWDFGCRWHEDKQTRWVKPGQRFGNFHAFGTTDIKPEDIQGDLAEMMVDQFPAVAARLSKVTPENHESAVREAAGALQDTLRRLREAQEKMAQRKGDSV